MNESSFAQVEIAEKWFKMQSALKCHQAKHDNLHLECPEEDCEYWTTLPHYLRDDLTRYHGPLLVCEFSLNGVCLQHMLGLHALGMKSTVHSSISVQKQRRTKVMGGDGKEGEGGNNGEDGNDGDN